jgi:hypothetical protein
MSRAIFPWQRAQRSKSVGSIHGSMRPWDFWVLFVSFVLFRWKPNWTHRLGVAAIRFSSTPRATREGKGREPLKSPCEPTDSGSLFCQAVCRAPLSPQFALGAEFCAELSALTSLVLRSGGSCPGPGQVKSDLSLMMMAPELDAARRPVESFGSHKRKVNINATSTTYHFFFSTKAV